jgi:hypothetical protein
MASAVAEGGVERTRGSVCCTIQRSTLTLRGALESTGASSSAGAGLILALDTKAAAPPDGSGRCTADGVQLAEEAMAWFREKAASLKPLGFDYTEQTERPWSQLLNV